MPLYEHVYLARQDVSTQQVEELTAQYKGIIEQAGGSVAKTEYWGVKTLSHRMKKNRKAHFTLLKISAPPAAIAEVERQMRLSEDVLRFMTIRVEEDSDGPSAMTPKAERGRVSGEHQIGAKRLNRKEDVVAHVQSYTGEIAKELGSINDQLEEFLASDPNINSQIQ